MLDLLLLLLLLLLLGRRGLDGRPKLAFFRLLRLRLRFFFSSGEEDLRLLRPDRLRLSLCFLFRFWLDSRDKLLLGVSFRRFGLRDRLLRPPLPSSRLRLRWRLRL